MRLTIASAILAGTALVCAGLDYLGSMALGSSGCDIYCGQPWVFWGVVVVIPLILVLWLAGAIVSVVAVVLARGRWVVPWIVIGVSLVIPVLVFAALINTFGS